MVCLPPGWCSSGPKRPFLRAAGEGAWSLHRAVVHAVAAHVGVRDADHNGKKELCGGLAVGPIIVGGCIEDPPLAEAEP